MIRSSLFTGLGVFVILFIPFLFYVFVDSLATKTPVNRRKIIKAFFLLLASGFIIFLGNLIQNS